MKGNEWEVNFQFTASSNRYGADGIAFWYTKDPVTGGDAIGGTDFWTGLGIFFDTHDNDHNYNNPTIYGIWNDGTKKFQHDLDGGNDVIGRCEKVRFRNQKTPVDVKISYLNEQLEVMYKITKEWKTCFKSSIKIPSDYYFGLSAATGKYFDRHIIHSFNVKSNTPDFQQEFYNDVYSDESSNINNENTQQVNQPLNSNNKESDEVDQTLKEIGIKLRSLEDGPHDYAERIHTSLNKLQELSDSFNDFLIKKLDYINGKSKSDIPTQSLNQVMKLIGADIITPLRKYKPLNNLNLDATKEKIRTTEIKNFFDESETQIVSSKNFLNERMRKYLRNESDFDYWIILLIVQILIILFLYIRVRRRIKKYDF